MSNKLKNFFEEEIRPQIDPQGILRQKAEQAENEERFEDAMLFLENALLVNPENKEVQEKLKEIRKLRIKKFAHRFIQRFYPSELNIFDVAWRVLSDIQPEDFKQEAISGALGIVGREPSKLKTPKVIILLSRLASEDTETWPDEEITENLTEIGRSIRCSQELVDQVLEFILKS